MRTRTALVKDGTGLIRTPNLYLHEISPMVLTLWTSSIRAVDVPPGIITPQDVVHLLLGDGAGDAAADGLVGGGELELARLAV